ncbi:MAG: leucine-rich repeat domain-containing protein [Clostridia bacterium]|nr:leucine-rich repeat domain-containing protein [Clostridia bacterium]
MKKIIALLLCAVMCFAFTGCLAGPEVEETTVPTTEFRGELPISGVEGSYKYDEYSDHIVLTQYTGKEANLYIPDTIKGKPVTGFGTIFKGNMKIVSVLIGKNCREIVDEAFADCYNLQRVQIDGGVKSIGKLAFFGCQALKLIYIPACVEKIEDDSFKYCTDLIIYGATGSEAERFAGMFRSVYFRDLEQARGDGETTMSVEQPSDIEGTPAEETTVITIAD